MAGAQRCFYHAQYIRTYPPRRYGSAGECGGRGAFPASQGWLTVQGKRGPPAGHTQQAELLDEKTKEKLQKPCDFGSFCGGDYRTRICDLLRVKIRMEIKPVLLCPLGAVWLGRGCSLELPRPLFPSARFAVWVGVWVMGQKSFPHSAPAEDAPLR